MELKRVIRAGTLEEIRKWILESRPPGANIVMDGRYYVLLTPERRRIAAVGLKRLSWCLTEVKHLVVVPAERRKGYGRRAVELALARVRTRLAIATVREENLASWSLFRSLGFDIAIPFPAADTAVRLMVKQMPAWEEPGIGATPEAPASE